LFSTSFAAYQWDLVHQAHQGPELWRQIAIDAGLSEGYAVRRYSSNKHEFSQINLSGGFEVNLRTKFIVDTLKPHIHQAYVRIHQRQSQTCLEEREKSILQMLQKGLSRKMIADDLGISESRTQQLMNKIYVKLDAHNAPHAIALCLSKRLIDFI